MSGTDAAGKVECGKGLQVTGNIVTEGTLQVGRGILAGGSITCAAHLEANFGVKAGADITAGGAIRVGESLMAAGRIAAGSGYGIFAGLNVRADEWSDSGKVCASSRPESLMSGLWQGGCPLWASADTTHWHAYPSIRIGL